MDSSDIIYIDDIIAMFDGKVSYRSILALIRTRKLKAMKIGKRYILSKQYVENFFSKEMGIA